LLSSDHSKSFEIFIYQFAIHCDKYITLEEFGKIIKLINMNDWNLPRNEEYNLSYINSKFRYTLKLTVNLLCHDIIFFHKIEPFLNIILK